jgi:hypothetical protein
MKALPIGIQSFRKLREYDFLYVDKTELIYQMVKKPGVYFFSRPRRFGKSLLLSTLKEIFLGNKFLFKGLWIEDKIDWQAFPVVHLSFDAISSKEETIEVLLAQHLQNIAEQHGHKLQSKGIKSLTLELIQKLSKQQQRVVFLIDEYDKPILDALPEDLALAEQRRDVLKEFFETLKNQDENIHFIFITGITKFSRMSIFSGLNNLSDISLQEQYATLCGYTSAELETHFGAAFPSIAASELLELADFKTELKNWYNGYNWLGEKVYNPWSILKLIETRRFDNYWFASGHPAFLIKLLKKGLYFELEQLSIPKAILDSFELDNIDHRALLFQTGYLTIEKENRQERSLTLGFPNREIEESLLNHMLAAYAESSIADTGLTAQHLKNKLKASDVDGAMVVLNALFQSIPHPIFLAQYEAYFHSILHIAFTLLGIYVQSEAVFAHGRADAVVELEDKVFIFEFKINAAAAVALAQIKARDYAGKYTASSKKITLLGVALSTEKKGIVDWQIETLG